MARTETRVTRTAAVLIAALFLIAVAGGCGSNRATPGTAAQESAQDKAVEAADRVAARQARVARARQLVVLRRQATQTSLALRRATAADPGKRVLDAFGFTVDDLCARIKSKGGSRSQKLAERALELRRKRALNYLNLSCAAGVGRARG